MFNNTSYSCQKFKERELANFKSLHPLMFEKFGERSYTYYRDGMHNLDLMINSGELSPDLVWAALEWRKQDSRYEFLYDVPIASFFAAARANNLEEAFFGQQTMKVSQLAMLISIFTNLLDGIVDEVPEIIDSTDLKFIATQLTMQDWKDSRIVPEGPLNAKRHPIVTLLLEVMQAIIRHVMDAKEWQNQADIREQFSIATSNSVTAEIQSTSYKIGAYWPTDFNYTIKELESKSIDPAWVGLLCPICFHGWPKGIDSTNIKKLATYLGSLGGWLDDTSDLHKDLESQVWSSLLLEIYRTTHKQASSPNMAISMLAWGIDNDSIQNHLSHKGEEKLNQLITYMKSLPILNEDIMKLAIVDTICIFLKSDEGYPSFYQEIGHSYSKMKTLKHSI